MTSIPSAVIKPTGETEPLEAVFQNLGAYVPAVDAGRAPIYMHRRAKKTPGRPGTVMNFNLGAKPMLKILSIFLSLSFLSSSMILAATPEKKRDSRHDSEPKEHQQEVHWSYTGKTGPDYWGNLDSAFATCGQGARQSPIDIADVAQSKKRKLHFIYNRSNLYIVNNGHTIQVNYDIGSVLEVDNNRYFLVQFHFHTPSENKINGSGFPMEMHLVHVNLKRQLAVVTVFLKEGSQSALLQNIVRHMPTSSNEKIKVEKIKIDVNDLLPASKSHYQFSGSLTTPPCSEGVKWIVLKNPVEMSNDQISRFTEVLGDNARPVQPLNDRIVYESS